MFGQAPVLPFSFARHTCRFGGFDTIPSSTDSMAGHMGRRHRLTRGTGGKTRCGIGFRCPSSDMGCQRIPSHLGHLKHTRTGSCPTCLDGFARTMVIRICLLEAGKHMLGTLSSPNRQCFLVLLADSMTHANDTNSAGCSIGSRAKTSFLSPQPAPRSSI
jgi:hypothetical protein